jgi:hypothetical protein
MGEVALLEIFPDALGGIELGRIGRQRNGRDVLGEFQVVGLVPAGLIDEQGDVLVGPDRRRETVDVKLHAEGIHVRQHQREGIVCSRLDGTVDVGECITLIGYTRWPLAPCEPAAADTAFLADPSFILEENPQALVFMCISKLLQNAWRFLKKPRRLLDFSSDGSAWSFVATGPFRAGCARST